MSSGHAELGMPAETRLLPPLPRLVTRQRGNTATRCAPATSDKAPSSIVTDDPCVIDAESPAESGASGNRTRDLPDANRTLSQLSYGPAD